MVLVPQTFLALSAITEQMCVPVCQAFSCPVPTGVMTSGPAIIPVWEDYIQKLLQLEFWMITYPVSLLREKVKFQVKPLFKIR